MAALPSTTMSANALSMQQSSSSPAPEGGKRDPSSQLAAPQQVSLAHPSVREENSGEEERDAPPSSALVADADAEAEDAPSSSDDDHPDDPRDPLDPSRFRGVEVSKRRPPGGGQPTKSPWKLLLDSSLSSPSAAPSNLLFTATARWKKRAVVVGTAQPTAAAAAVARDRALFALAGREALLVGTGAKARRGPDRLNFPASNYPEAEGNHLREGDELERFLESLRAGVTPARGGPVLLDARYRRCGKCGSCSRPWLKKKCLGNGGVAAGRSLSPPMAPPPMATTAAAAAAKTTRTAVKMLSPVAARRRSHYQGRAAPSPQPRHQSIPLSASKVAKRELELRAEAAATAALLSAERGGGGGSCDGGNNSNFGSSGSDGFYRSIRSSSLQQQQPSPISSGMQQQQGKPPLRFLDVSRGQRHEEHLFAAASSRGVESSSKSFDFHSFLAKASAASKDSSIGRFSFVALPRSGAHAPRRCALCREVGAHAGGKRSCPKLCFLEEKGGGESKNAAAAVAASPSAALPAPPSSSSLPEAVAALAAAVRAPGNVVQSPSKRRKKV